MTAQELRIGNYIKWGAHTLPVLSIFTGTSMGNSSPYVCLPHPASIQYLEQIEPIPLTPEIMEKAGISVVRLNGYDYLSQCVGVYEDGTLVYVISSHSDDYGGNNYAHVEITHMHQLQNIHFAVTGEELQISL